MDNVNGFIPSPLMEERTRINKYFVVLQLELAKKTTQLAGFQQDLNERVTRVLKLNKYGVFQDNPEDVTSEGVDVRYLPNKKFLPRHWLRYQITTKTDTISEGVKRLSPVRWQLLQSLGISALRHIMPLFVVLLDKLVGITPKFIH